jgi:hypothetical protein
LVRGLFYEVNFFNLQSEVFMKLKCKYAILVSALFLGGIQKSCAMVALGSESEYRELGQERLNAFYAKCAEACGAKVTHFDCPICRLSKPGVVGKELLRRAFERMEKAGCAEVKWDAYQKPTVIEKIDLPAIMFAQMDQFAPHVS